MIIRSIDAIPRNTIAHNTVEILYWYTDFLVSHFQPTEGKNTCQKVHKHFQYKTLGRPRP